jgi:hypothetical protein
MKSPEKRFEKLTATYCNPSDAAVLRRFLFGGRYAVKQIDILLGLAERKIDAMEKVSPFSTPILLVTAGGSGAGKSTLLFQIVAGLHNIDIPAADWREASLFRAREKIFNTVPFTLISSDRDGLLDLALRLRGEPTSDRAFYELWKPGTNFHFEITAKAALRREKNIALDTSLSREETVRYLEDVRKSGHHYVAVELGAAPEDVRRAAVDVRNKGFEQSRPEQLRISEAFACKFGSILASAHQVRIHWRDTADEPLRPVAKIIEKAGIKYLMVIDKEALHRFRCQYPRIEHELRSLPRKEPGEIVDPLPGMIRAQVAQRGDPRLHVLQRRAGQTGERVAL